MRIEFWADRDKRIMEPKIFSKEAQELSTLLAGKGRETNKRTQIRKFYDEVLRLDQDAKIMPEKDWPNILARLHLLIPRAVYAQGRNNLVSEEFVNFIRTSVNQVETKEDLTVFASLFEAFMGFYRLDRPKD